MNEMLIGLDIRGAREGCSRIVFPMLTPERPVGAEEPPGQLTRQSILVNETAELVAPSQPDWLRIANTQRLLCWWASGACRPSERRRAMFVVGAVANTSSKLAVNLASRSRIR